MHLRINASDATPVYAQVMQQIKFLVASGTLKPGDQLPTVRDLAVQLTINPNTVVKVYRELEHDEVIVSRKGRGTFVAEKATRLSEQARTKILSEQCRSLASDAVNLGISQEKLTGILEREYRGIVEGETENE